MSDGFLSRWSRRKAEARTPPVPAPEAPPAAAPATAPTEAEPDPVADLPPIESLTPDSDFSPFLRAGVPDDLRKAAMSRLWASDPLFARPEVYDLHMDDYTQPAITEAVETAWNFGKEAVERLNAAAHQPANFPDGPEGTQNEAGKDDVEMGRG